MLDFVLRPEKSFMDPAEVAERPKAGRLHVAPGNVMPIARGLLSRRLLRPLRDRDLIYVAGKSLPNAFFGVGKGTYIGKEAGKAEGQEVRHLIMNLTCPSKLTFDNCGDIAALPFYGQEEHGVWGLGEIVLESRSGGPRGDQNPRRKERLPGHRRASQPHRGFQARVVLCLPRALGPSS